MELSLSDGVWWFGHYPSEWRIGYLALLKIPVELSRLVIIFPYGISYLNNSVN